MPSTNCTAATALLFQKNGEEKIAYIKEYALDWEGCAALTYKSVILQWKQVESLMHIVEREEILLKFRHQTLGFTNS